MALLALAKKAEGEAVNIGSGNEWSIKETVEIILDIIGSNIEIISDESRIRPEKSEVNRLIADNSKINLLPLGKIKLLLEMGLKKLSIGSKKI